MTAPLKPQKAVADATATKLSSTERNRVRGAQIARDSAELEQDNIAHGMELGSPLDMANNAVVARQRMADTRDSLATAKVLTPHDVLNGADPQMRRSPHR